MGELAVLRAGALACAAPLLASAQQAAPSASVAQLDTIVVTASRTPQELKNVLSDTSVIDRETLSRAGQSSLAEVLSRSHGIEYVNNGGPQTATSLFMRGANSNQTLVLIDGQRINNASSGKAGATRGDFHSSIIWNIAPPTGRSACQ